MAGTSRLLIASAVGGLMLVGGPAASNAQSAVERSAEPVSHIASFPPGSIQGTVLDEHGNPVVGAVVSAMGGSTLIVVTDRNGRFELRTLPPGPYLVRAHLAGYVTPPAQIVQVRSSARSASAIALRRTGSATPILAAGLGAFPEPAPATVDDPSPDGTPQTTDEGETAWRLRHGRRSILKEVTLPADLFARDDEPRVSPFGTATSVKRSTASFFTEMPFSGQVNLLTSSSFDVPQQIFTPASLPSSIANLRVSAPVGDHAVWTVRAALTQSDTAAWNIAGSYATRAPARNDYNFGVSYSAQRYDGGNPLALNGATSSRSVGEVYAFDTLTLTPALAITYGSRYTRYDYLDDRNLASPRIELALTPAEHLRVSARLSERAQAPGAEEFLPPNESGIWLPPQRLFSSLDPESPLRAERVTDAAIEVARDIAGFTVGVRAFHQHTNDQMVTLFGAHIPDQPMSELGHYFVADVGNTVASGCAASIRAALSTWLRGSIEYSVTSAQLIGAGDTRYLVLTAPSAAGSRTERIHDVSTMLETRVPETATRIVVLFRMSNGFAHPPRGSDPSADRPSVDSRFDVQVHQSLPFMNFTSAKWEMLLGVRNFFRDPIAADGQSVYDELLVVRPPKRIVGGLTMHF